MRVGLAESITAMQTRAEQVRKGAKLVDRKAIGKLLETMTDDDRPIILEVYGVKKDRLPGDYFLRECRKIFIYEGVKYQALEKVRREKEKEVTALAVRQAKLDEIKNRLRSRLKADDANFNKRYDAQSRERAEIVEAEIEREALTVFEKEEQE